MADEKAKKSVGKVIGDSIKDVVPKTTGGKVAGGIFSATIAGVSFLIGRITKKGCKSE